MERERRQAAMAEGGMTLAIKCAPEASKLDAAAEAGIEAVELFTDQERLQGAEDIVRVCSGYPFRYAVHAPGEGYEPDALAWLIGRLGAEAVVFHDVYFEDEWEYMVEKLSPLGARLCLENMLSAVDAVKYLRRFGLKRCLDLEHLILETAGIFEEPYLILMRQAAHVHMTGYVHGSRSWHTHIHHAPEQSRHLLGLLRQAGYSGLVVSEARSALQTLEEFRGLRRFFEDWREAAGA